MRSISIHWMNFGCRKLCTKINCRQWDKMNVKFPLKTPINSSSVESTLYAMIKDFSMSVKISFQFGKHCIRKWHFMCSMRACIWLHFDVKIRTASFGSNGNENVRVSAIILVYKQTWLIGCSVHVWFPSKRRNIDMFRNQWETTIS